MPSIPIAAYTELSTCWHYVNARRVRCVGYTHLTKLTAAQMQKMLRWRHSQPREICSSATACILSYTVHSLLKLYLHKMARKDAHNSL